MYVLFRYVLWMEVIDIGRGIVVFFIEKNVDNKLIFVYE